MQRTDLTLRHEPKINLSIGDSLVEEQRQQSKASLFTSFTKRCCAQVSEAVRAFCDKADTHL